MNNEDFKVVLSDKEYIEKLEKEVCYQNKEVTRLNNTINELEKFVKENGVKLYNYHDNFHGKWLEDETILDKLKELKEE